MEKIRDSYTETIDFIQRELYMPLEEAEQFLELTELNIESGKTIQSERAKIVDHILGVENAYSDWTDEVAVAKRKVTLNDARFSDFPQYLFDEEMQNISAVEIAAYTKLRETWPDLDETSDKIIEMFWQGWDRLAAEETENGGIDIRDLFNFLTNFMYFSCYREGSFRLLNRLSISLHENGSKFGSLASKINLQEFASMELKDGESQWISFTPPEEFNGYRGVENVVEVYRYVPVRGRLKLRIVLQKGQKSGELDGGQMRVLLMGDENDMEDKAKAEENGWLRTQEELVRLDFKDRVFQACD